jgi:hypothetical protein
MTTEEIHDDVHDFFGKLVAMVTGTLVNEVKP